jgi:hypothetical protein
VTEDEWHQARAGARQRESKPGAIGSRVNVFQGLLKNARDHESYYSSLKVRPGRAPKYMLLSSGGDGRGHLWGFPLEPFERAVFSLLREIDPRDVLDGANGHGEVMALEGEFGQVEVAIAAIAADLDLHGESPTLYARLRRKEARKAELAGQLADARQRAAHPLSQAWGECKTLLDVLDSAPDPTDARLRLRAVLRRTVDSAWLLVVPRGKDRLAAVQVWFTGGEHCRDYLIYSKSAGCGRQGSWLACSLADAAQLGPCDLRNRADAHKLEALLATVGLEALLADMQKQPTLKRGAGQG